MTNLQPTLMVLHFLTIFWFTINKVEGLAGGHVAKPQQIKYQVSFQANLDHRCGAVIITDRHVLTAAHCVLDDKDQFYDFKMTVVGGVIDTRVSDPNRIEVEVDKIYVPDEYTFIDYSTPYTKVSKGDIAVLRLKRSLELESNPVLEKVKLPEEFEDSPIYNGKKPIISGFGYYKLLTNRNSNGQTDLEFIPNYDKLHFIETEVIPQNICQSMYSGPIDEAQFCAQANQYSSTTVIGVCRGDSGGPLVLDGEILIGILVEGPLYCNERNHAGIYLNVAKYLPFIRKALNDETDKTIRSVSLPITNRKRWDILSIFCSNRI